MDTYSLIELRVAHSQRIDLSCQLALTTMIIYNAITRLDKEIKYIWCKPNSFISIVYFSSQYLGIFSTIAAIWHYLFGLNNRLCTFSLVSSSLTEWLVVLEIEYILLLRVIVLFSQDAQMAKWLKFFYCSQGIFALFILAYSFRKYDLETSGFAFCQIESGITPLFQSLRCIGPFVFEIVLVSLVVYKSISVNTGTSPTTRFTFTLLKVLLQDQVVFFAWIFCCFMTHMISMAIDRSEMPNMPLSIYETLIHGSTLPCIIGGWLMIHLKEVAERGETIIFDTNIMGAGLPLSEGQVLSSMRFAQST